MTQQQIETARDIVAALEADQDLADEVAKLVVNRHLQILPDKFGELIHLNRINHEAFVQAITDTNRFIQTLVDHLNSQQNQLDSIKTDTVELTAEVTAAVAGLDKAANELNTLKTAVQNLQRELQPVTARLTDMETRVNRLDGVRGATYENKVSRNIAGILGERMDLVRITNHRSTIQGISTDIEEQILTATRAGRISRPEAVRLTNADLICQAEYFSTGAKIAIVGEVAINLDRNDLERAVDRADILSRVVSAETKPILVGVTARPTLREEAQEAGAELITYPE